MSVNVSVSAQPVYHDEGTVEENKEFMDLIYNSPYSFKELDENLITNTKFLSQLLTVCNDRYGKQYKLDFNAVMIDPEIIRDPRGLPDVYFTGAAGRITYDQLYRREREFLIIHLSTRLFQSKSI
jgi:hypothetical protein